MSPLLIALQFLTCLPVRLAGMPPPNLLGRSLLWYPSVGLLLGAMLCGMAFLLCGKVPALLLAALVLTVWVVLTGALHLDGLADSADAWLGGLGNRERTLLIMKDPRSGPLAIVALVLVLLLKYAALVILIEHGQMLALLLAPWVARGLLPLLFATVPYVREGGLGHALVEHLPRQTLPWVLGAHGLAVLLLGLPGLLAMVIALVLFAWLRQLMITRIGGTTGDTAGAWVELSECAVLVGLALN